MLVEFLKRIENLGKIGPDIAFIRKFPLFLQLREKIYEISVVAVLQNHINDILVYGNVLNSDNVLVLPQFDEGLYLLPGGHHNVLDFLYMLL